MGLPNIRDRSTPIPLSQDHTGRNFKMVCIGMKGDWVWLRKVTLQKK